MVRDKDIKECKISYLGQDEVTGSVFLTKQEYEIMKKNMNPKNWYNKVESGIYSPIVDIFCKEFELG